MDNSRQKDDMTRIGGFLHPLDGEDSPPAGEAQPASLQSPLPGAPPTPPQPPLPPSYAPPEAAPSFALREPAAPPATPTFPPTDHTLPPTGQAPHASPSVFPPPEPAFPPPGPSAPSPGPSFAAAGPSSAPRPWTQERPPSRPAAAPVVADDMWFVVDQANPPLEHPLREGQQVSVGREANQDIVIMDKTLSRNHLVLTRRGDRIAAQVLGLNGLVYAGQVYKSTKVELVAPCALTVGNVSCRIKKKVDTEATILMTDPAVQARQQGMDRLTPQPSAPAAQRSDPPVWPPPEEPGLFSPQQPVYPAGQEPSPVFGAGRAEPLFPATPQAQAPPREHHDSAFPGQSASTPFSPATPADPRISKGDGNRKLFLYGGLGLVLVLIVGVALFLWLRKPAPPQPPAAPPQAGPPQQQAAPQPQVEPVQVSSLHSQYLSKAKSYMAAGKALEACDYLKDIPATSPLRAEAAELAKQIPGCSL